MARSDLLRRLFAAYSRGDDAVFRAVANEIVADERRKQHRLLAEELEQALTRDLKPGAATPLTLRPIPRGRDERPLVALVKPQHEIDDLVLGEQPTAVLSAVGEENRARGVLASHGLRPRQRLLFVGPSGTGKSASAHALAAELSLPVAVVSLAALTSSFLGETARNIEAVVRFAEGTPCVLLFDEFDAIAGERGGSSDHAEFRRVVAAVLHLLEEMHGESLVVATSNHPTLLDAALWRRFDEVAVFDYLSGTAMARLIEAKLNGVGHQVRVQSWATQLRDQSPAEVELICLDALRQWVMSGVPMLTDDVFSGSVARAAARWRAMAHLKRINAEREDTPSTSGDSLY